MLSYAQFSVKRTQQLLSMIYLWISEVLLYTIWLSLVIMSNISFHLTAIF